jgi:hypothetical protein
LVEVKAPVFALQDVLDPRGAVVEVLPYLYMFMGMNERAEPHPKEAMIDAPAWKFILRNEEASQIAASRKVMSLTFWRDHQMTRSIAAVSLVAKHTY